MGYCPNCGKPVPDDAAFCPSCAYKLAGSAGPSQPQPAPAFGGVQPRRETPMHGGSIVGGAAVAFVLLIVIGWIPIIGALIAGFVAGVIARGAGRGATAGFIGGIAGGIIAVLVLGAVGTLLGGVIGLGFLGGIIGAGVGGALLLLGIGNTVVCIIGGAIGGAIRA